MSATGPQAATPDEDDWDLPGRACMIDENGNIDPECESCQ